MSAYETVMDLCKKSGKTPTAVERELGFGRGSIGKMRTSEMTHSRLAKLAEYFGVSVDYLMTGIGTEKSSTSGKKYYFDDDTAQKAQELFDNPDLRILFDAAKGSRAADLQMAADLLKRLKETNPDG